MSGAVLDGSQAVHSVRGFVGYENRLNEAVTFLTGFEYLYDLEASRNWRAQWVSELASKLTETFQLSLMFAARYDHEPVAGKDELDTLTTVNLVLSLI